MHTQLLSIFGVLVTATLPLATTAWPKPTITPGAVFAVGDNVIGKDFAGQCSLNFDPIACPTFTNAHNYTLNLSDGAKHVISMDLWPPPLSGSTVRATPSGAPTATVLMSATYLAWAQILMGPVM